MGDINGDGCDDLAISMYDTTGDRSVYIFFGGNPPDTEPDLVLEGIYRIKPIGDFNNDNYPDYIAYPHDDDRWTSYLLIGGNPPMVDSSFSLPGRIPMSPGSSNYHYMVPSALGDINNDGYDDFSVRFSGAINDATNDSFNVFYGDDEIDSIPDLIIQYQSPDERLSQSYFPGRIGFDSDEYYDLNFFTFLAANADYLDSVTYFIHHGPQLESEPTITRYGKVDSDSVANFFVIPNFLDDFDNDGWEDLVTNGTVRTWNYFYDIWVNVTHKFIIKGGPDLDPENPEIIGHINMGLLVSGLGFTPVGDVNGDGFNDVIGHNYQAAFSGVAFLFLGGPSILVDPVAWWTGGGDLADNVGLYVTRGDLNGDGLNDIIFSAGDYDNNLEIRGHIYAFSGTTDWVNPYVETFPSNSLPSNYVLNTPYPNPFNQSQFIQYTIAEETFVSLTVIDLLGRHINKLVNKKQLPGEYSVNWKPKNIPSGLYYLVLQTDFGRLVQKTIHLK